MNLIPCDKDCINQVEGILQFSWHDQRYGEQQEKAAFTIRKAGPRIKMRKVYGLTY